jgi:hypothetical protein
MRKDIRESGSLYIIVLILIIGGGIVGYFYFDKYMSLKKENLSRQIKVETLQKEVENYKNMRIDIDPLFKSVIDKFGSEITVNPTPVKEPDGSKAMVLVPVILKPAEGKDVKVIKPIYRDQELENELSVKIPDLVEARLINVDGDVARIVIKLRDEKTKEFIGWGGYSFVSPEQIEYQ